jgi:murein DD-endopeptidase MepM/ murein hydrolase activator NlpD
MLLCSTSYGATNTRQAFLKSQHKVQSFKKQITNLEKKLNEKNNYYLRTVRQRQKLDFDIYDLQKKLNDSIVNLQKKSDSLSAEKKYLLLNSINQQSALDLLKKKALVRRVTQKKAVIDKEIESQKVMKKHIYKLRLEFDNTVALEKELADVIRDIEARKSGLAQNYISEKEHREQLLVELKKEKRQKRKKRIGMSKKTSEVSKESLLVSDFDSPIKKFISYDHDKKGITYIVKDQQDIFASKSGKVSYKGTLANYGNVVMVDHGDNVRSIYLGDFTSSLKKGATINKGQILGQTRRPLTRGAVGKVYFEIRRKNIVQNTIKLVKIDQLKL